MGSPEPSLPLFELMMRLSHIADSVSPIIENHNKGVAYISFALANELGWSDEKQAEVFLAGSLHDIGAFSLKSKLKDIDFEGNGNNNHEHGRIGFYLLKDFPPLRKVAEDIRFLNVMWDDGAGAEFEGKSVPKSSHIIHLADKIAVLLKPGAEVLGQRRGIVELIAANSGNMFVPEMVEAFQTIAEREYFWLDLTSGSLDNLLRRHLSSTQPHFENGDVQAVANFLRRFIDFRSRFTATHSVGVAVVAESLAQLAGFDQSRQRMIRIAGWLHDLGKVAIPTEILEKPGRLSWHDVNAMRKHTYYSYQALENIDGMQEINKWVSWHHERLDGSGYPFRLKADQIPTGARIIAVADFFTAITEDRPYRSGMPQDEALCIMKNMANSKGLDSDLVNQLDNNCDQINSIRAEVQAASVDEYETFSELSRNGD